MMAFLILDPSHNTQLLIMFLLATLGGGCAWYAVNGSNARKRLFSLLMLSVLGTVVCGVEGIRVCSPWLALLPLAIFGARWLWDQALYEMGAFEQTPPDTQPTQGSEAKPNEESPL